MSRLLQVLESTAKVTANLSELLFFSAWLLSLPANNASQPRPTRELLTRQALHCAVYAVTEPLYTSLFLRTGLEPLIFVLATSTLHLLVFIMFTHAVGIASSGPRPQSVSETETPHQTDKVESERSQSKSRGPTQSPPSNIDTDARKSHYDRVCSVFEHTHVQTSAACNASILLLGQRLSVESGAHSPPVRLWLSAFSLAFFFASRMADFNFASLTRRPLFSQFFSRVGLASATALLALVITLRAVMRGMLGMGILGMLEQNAAIQGRFRPGRDDWWREAIEGMPTWLPFALSALAVGMMGLSKVFMARAGREM